MTIEEIENQIKELQVELEELKNQKSIIYEPKNEDMIYEINHVNEFRRTQYLGIQRHLDSIVFNSQEKAIDYIKIMRPLRRLAQIAVELNDGWEPNWGDQYKKKFYIRKNKDTYEVYPSYAMDSITIYFKSEEAAKKAIKEMQRLGIWE